MVQTRVTVRALVSAMPCRVPATSGIPRMGWGVIHTHTHTQASLEVLYQQKKCFINYLWLLFFHYLFLRRCKDTYCISQLEPPNKYPKAIKGPSASKTWWHWRKMGKSAECVWTELVVDGTWEACSEEEGERDAEGSTGRRGCELVEPQRWGPGVLHVHMFHPSLQL